LQLSFAQIFSEQALKCAFFFNFLKRPKQFLTTFFLANGFKIGQIILILAFKKAKWQPCAKPWLTTLRRTMMKMDANPLPSLKCHLEEEKLFRWKKRKHRWIEDLIKCLNKRKVDGQTKYWNFIILIKYRLIER